MNQQNFKKMQKQATLAVIIGGALLISIPVMAAPRTMRLQRSAQNSSSSPLNPHPSIFNEPPYTSSSSTTDNSSSGTMQMPGMDTTSGNSMRPSGPSSTSPQNPNLPAEAPSPSLQQQNAGGGDQPTKPTGVKKHGRRKNSSPSSTSPQNPNLPAEAPSPSLQQQNGGGGNQPTKPTGTNNRSGGNSSSDSSNQNPNQPATIPAPDSNQNGASPK